MNTRERSQEQSRAVRAFIHDRITAGDLSPGDRVPTERVLSEKFEIGRNTVRSVLHDLEREGLIVRHVGRGTFVAETGAGLPTAKSLNIDEMSPSDIMEVRLLVEPGIGELVVLRATQSDFEAMQKSLDRAEAARSWHEFERWDAAFHEALATATKNRALIDILQSVNKARDHAMWGKLKKKSLTQSRRAVYERQHRAILAALMKREAADATKAIRQHLMTVRENLLGF